MKEEPLLTGHGAGKKPYQQKYFPCIIQEAKRGTRKYWKPEKIVNGNDNIYICGLILYDVRPKFLENLQKRTSKTLVHGR